MKNDQVQEIWECDDWHMVHSSAPQSNFGQTKSLARESKQVSAKVSATLSYLLKTHLRGHWIRTAHNLASRRDLMM
jgi:hypothetical protein